MGYSARYAFEEDYEEVTDFPRLLASGEEETPVEAQENDVPRTDIPDESMTELLSPM
jgi:hypothetical protein